MKKPTVEQINSLIHNHMLGRVGMDGSLSAARAILAEFADEPAYPESFANQPKSILEERANRVRGGADVWTVRDALLAALRDVDSGGDIPSGFVLDQCQIILVGTGPENETVFRYYRRVKSRLEGLGILDTAMFDCHAEGSAGG